MREGSTVVVLGAGGALGSAAAALAAHRGATVVAVEHVARKRDVLDTLGLPDLWERHRPALADRGRIVVSGAIGREPIPVGLLGSCLRSQSSIGVGTGNRAQVAALWRDVHDGFRLPAALPRRAFRWRCGQQGPANRVLTGKCDGRRSPAVPGPW